MTVAGLLATTYKEAIAFITLAKTEGETDMPSVSTQPNEVKEKYINIGRQIAAAISNAKGVKTNIE